MGVTGRSQSLLGGLVRRSQCSLLAKHVRGEQLGGISLSLPRAVCAHVFVTKVSLSNQDYSAITVTPGSSV